MARRAATQQLTSGRPSEEVTRTTTSSAARVRLALYGVLASSAAIAVTILYIHARLAATHGTYTSFCNVNARIDCDAVLTSRYSLLLGSPLAGWGLLTYIALAGMLAWQGRTSGPSRAQATLLFLGGSIWTCVFSLYMAAISVVLLGTICLLCSGMYLLGIALAALAWRLARTEISGPLFTPRRLGIEVAAILVSLALVGSAQLTTLPDGDVLTPEGVRAANPEFYRWYTTQPVADRLPPERHVKGPADAPITIVEFSDFECTYCGMAFRDLRDLLRRHPGSVRIVFHHFPLDRTCNQAVDTTLHHSACLAAVAAECAARQDRFWEYHDALFGAQDRLGRDQLIAQATALGIDRDTFSACLDASDSVGPVTNDIDAGARLGVESTPTLFINGRAVKGALDRQFYEYVIALARQDSPQSN